MAKNNIHQKKLLIKVRDQLFSWGKVWLKRITLIDIFLLLIFAAIFWFMLSFFRLAGSDITVRFRVNQEDALFFDVYPRNEYAYAFRKGDVMRDEGGNVIAEITNVENYAVRTLGQLVYVDVKMKATHNSRRQEYSFRGQPIVFGQVVSMTFSKVTFEGMVVDFPGMEQGLNVESGKTRVKAQLRWDNRDFSDIYGVPTYMANAVKVGDEVKNAQGEAIIKVEAVSVTPAKRVVVNAQGQPLVVTDPELKDVYYTLELQTKKVNGRRYIFDFLPLNIGESVPLVFEQVSVYPIITEILE